MMLKAWIKELDLELRNISREFGPFAAEPVARMRPDLAHDYLLALHQWSGTLRAPPVRRPRGMFAKLGPSRLIAEIHPRTPPRAAVIWVRETIVSIVPVDYYRSGVD